LHEKHLTPALHNNKADGVSNMLWYFADLHRSGPGYAVFWQIQQN
jgi:hypothetical protein